MHEGKHLLNYRDEEKSHSRDGCSQTGKEWREDWPQEKQALDMGMKA